MRPLCVDGRHISTHDFAIRGLWLLAFILFLIALFLVQGLTLVFAEYALLAAILWLAAWHDWESYRIPNFLVLAGIALRILFVLIAGLLILQSWQSLLRESAVGFLCVSVPTWALACLMQRLTGKTSLGMGDVKLLAVVGMYFAWVINLYALLGACLTGIALSFIPRKGVRGGPIPFGMCIACAWSTAMLMT